jgi:DNA-binding HxlR family transcriptional regulator
MRSYGHFCSVARALDVVGDRWTLLIVRELLLQGPCRFTDLKDGLPGVASNLLSERLKELEDSGLVSRDAAQPPVATNLYGLTATGRALEPVIQALGLWGVQFSMEKRTDDAFRGQWLTYPVAWFLQDSRPDEPAMTVQIIADDEPVTLHVGGGHIHTERGTVPDPAVTLRGEPDKVLGFLAGFIDLKKARAAGVEVDGPARLLTRITPKAQHSMLQALTLD